MEPAIMKHCTGHTAVFALLLLGSIAGALPARAAVTRYYARENVRGEMVLMGVTVERGEAPEHRKERISQSRCRSLAA
jgi:hypothetical protein